MQASAGKSSEYFFGNAFIFSRAENHWRRLSGVNQRRPQRAGEDTGREETDPTSNYLKVTIESYKPTKVSAKLSDL